MIEEPSSEVREGIVIGFIGASTIRQCEKNRFGVGISLV